MLKEARDECCTIVDTDKKRAARVNRLVKEALSAGGKGIGKVERLRSAGGPRRCRIDAEDSIVTISCKGGYDDT